MSKTPTSKRKGDDWPSIEVRWKAARSHAAELNANGWNDDTLAYCGISLYHIVDTFPDDEREWIAARLELSDSQTKWLLKNSAWYARGAWREKWPAWRRVLFPLGPSRRTRTQYWRRFGYWSATDECLKLDPARESEWTNIRRLRA